MVHQARYDRFRSITASGRKNIGALVVISKGQLVGVVSERDYARKVVLQGRASMGTPVHEIMSAEVVTVSPQSTVQEAMAIMTEHRFRHLPVTEEGQVIGVISIGDLVESIIAEQDLMINQLESYISGSRS